MVKAFLAIIIFLAISVRLYQLNVVPAALNIDEAAIGYNAFAILITGADEHGRPFPLMFESFGDWKMPLYIYLTVPAVALFGLTETAVRLVSVLSGIGSVILIFFVAKKLFHSEKIALVASLLLALSPWSIFFSRMAIEANLANFLFLAGLLLLLSKKYFFSLLFFSLTMFAYHTFLIFTPLFLAGFALLNFRQIKISKSLIAGGLIFVVLLCAAWFTVQQSAKSKVSDVGFWNNQNVLYNRVEQFRLPQRDIVNKLLHNRYSGLANQFVQNYTATFAPSFLFDKGGEKTLHNTGFSGVLLLSDAVFLLAGLLFLIRAKSLAAKTILLWLILAPISSSLTLDHPSSTRLFAMLPALVLLAAFGIKSLNRHWLIAITISAVVAASALFWLDGYFNFLNQKRAEFMGAGFKEAVLETKKFPNHKVIWARAQEFPYIYVLFYSQTHPKDFQKSVVFFPKEAGAFNLVKSFGAFSFPTSLNKTGMEPPDFKKNTVYVERFGVHDKTYSVNLPSGEPRFWIYVSDHDGY